MTILHKAKKRVLSDTGNKTIPSPANTDRLTPSERHRIEQMEEDEKQRKEQLEKEKLIEIAKGKIKKASELLSEATQLMENNKILVSDISDRSLARLVHNFKNSAQSSSLSLEEKKIVDAIRLEKRPKWGRPNRNPVSFIKANYEDKLSSGTLKRHMLPHLDFPLAQAYASWIRPNRHPEDSLWPESDGSRSRLEKRGMTAEEQIDRVRKQKRESWQRSSLGSN